MEFGVKDGMFGLEPFRIICKQTLNHFQINCVEDESHFLYQSLSWPFLK